MRPEIDTVLTQHSGVATRTQLLEVVTRNQLDDEVARRHLVAPFASTYCRPWDEAHAPVLRRAALASVGKPVALSHLTALELYDLPARRTDLIHVTTSVARHPVGRSPGLIVHRTRVPTRLHTVDHLCVVEPAAAVVRSWPLQAPDDRRAAAIEAVRRRLTTPQHLGRICSRAVGLAGRGQLASLIDLLASGCESELEIWGCLGVFDVPGLRHGARQHRVVVGDTTFRLDLGYTDERVAVEMDGERFHAHARRREADRRRDALLATAGWLTLRFSWERLHLDVDGCRRDTLATLATRRAWPRSG